MSEVQIHLSSLFPELDVYKGNGAKNMLKKWSLYEIAYKIFNLIFYEGTCLSCLEDRGPVFI